jgi:hypothetical protein
MEKNATHSWSCGSNPVREQVQHQAVTRKNIFEHSDDLQGKNILATIIPNFEDRLLPHVVFNESFDAFAI